MYFKQLYATDSRQVGALFLICPDCQLEHRIRAAYGRNSYFLTALGAVFEPCEVARAEELNQFITSEGIRRIYVVNDTECTFMKNAVSREQNYHTRAEAVLKLLLRKNSTLQQCSCCSAQEKSQQLARLNVLRESRQLLDTAYIGHKIQDHDIELHGLVFDRHTLQFEEIPVG